MEIAINKNNELVTAVNAIHDIYFCSECGELSFLRKPDGKIPHFYHFNYNEKCSLCVKGTNNIISNSIKNALTNLQSNYPDRWNEAIICLYNNDCLYRLRGKAWAVNPLGNFLYSKLKQIDDSLYCAILDILLSIENFKSFKMLIDFIESPILDKEKMFYIEEEIYKRITYSSEKYQYIIDKNLEIMQLYKFFCHMDNNQKNNILKNEKYKIFEDVDYILDKDSIERYKYFQNKHDKTLLTNMLLYRINSLRNRAEWKLYRSINKISNDLYEDLYEYIKEHF